MSEEMPAGASGETLENAPGCETPAPERIDFPPLVAAGGVFKSIPKEDGTVDFDSKLVIDLPQWPRSKDAEGKDIPFPWEGHKRSVHLALTSDKFDTRAGYFQYRAFEAVEKARVALKQYTDAINGVQKAAATKADKTAKTLDSLKTLAAGLSPEEQEQVDKVLAMLKERTAKPIAV